MGNNDDIKKNNSDALLESVKELEKIAQNFNNTLDKLTKSVEFYSCNGNQLLCG